MTDEELRQRLSDQEDGWTERKEQGVSSEDLRKTFVAFANSIPDGEEAVLFVGVADDGQITGVADVENRQKHISKIIRDGCYPPVKNTTRVMEVEGRHVIAFIVQASYEKPHFAGPAYVRRASESYKASELIFDELIASRMSKARPLLEAKRKGQKITLMYWSQGRGNKIAGANAFRDCIVSECNPQYVTFERPITTPITASFDRITISWNHNTNQLQVDIEN
jgi:hypothetical protein